jgi:hypothetical protein
VMTVQFDDGPDVPRGPTLGPYRAVQFTGAGEVWEMDAGLTPLLLAVRAGGGWVLVGDVDGRAYRNAVVLMRESP